MHACSSVPHYINMIVDKSVLHSVSERGAKWLFHHFSVHLPPVLFAEVLADLEKSKGLATGTSDGQEPAGVGKEFPGEQAKPDWSCDHRFRDEGSGFFTTWNREPQIARQRKIENKSSRGALTKLRAAKANPCAVRPAIGGRSL